MTPEPAKSPHGRQSGLIVEEGFLCESLASLRLCVILCSFRSSRSAQPIQRRFHLALSVLIPGAPGGSNPGLQSHLGLLHAVNPRK